MLYLVWNSECFFLLEWLPPKAKSPIYPAIKFIVEGRRDRFMPFPKALVRKGMQQILDHNVLCMYIRDFFFTHFRKKIYFFSSG